MPTGGGKSLCFQLAGLAREGICIVVSPLISLMHDQVAALRRMGIPAMVYSSSETDEDRALAFEHLTGDPPALSFLYITPESILSPRFMERFDALHRRSQLALFAVDEAHCVSEEHQILTDRGFLFLNEFEAARDRGESLHVASFDEDSQQLVYELPSALVINDARDQQLLSFTSAQEARRWRTDADEWGRVVTDEGESLRSSRLSLQVTAEHDMYVRSGHRTKSGVTEWQSKPFAKVKAGDIAARSEQSIVKFLSRAEGGLAGAEDTLWCAAKLKLDSPAKQIAFMEFLGYWLGNGHLKYDGNAIICRPVKHVDDVWLSERLLVLQLEAGRDFSRTVESGPRYEYRISNPVWFELFDHEYSPKYSGSSRSSRPVSKEGTVVETASWRSSNLADEGIKSAKWLPWWCWRLTIRLSRAVIGGLRLATPASPHRTSEVGDCNTIWTSSARFRDELVRLMLHAGYSVHFTPEYVAGAHRGFIDGKAVVANHTSWKVCYTDNPSHAEPTVDVGTGVTSVPYIGRTWCVTMPHGFIVTRRARRGNDGRVQQASRPTVLGNCVSAWGHDFRHDYMELAKLQTSYPGVPLTALTATAAPRTKANVLEILGMRPDYVDIEGPLYRENLVFSVIKAEADPHGQAAGIVRARFRGARGIIYCMSKAEAEKAADAVTSVGLRARAYHAGMRPEARDAVQKAWGDGATDVVCATTAFGMGIDRPDVRFVLHVGMSASIAAYYQAAGRAGRDGAPAECIVLFKWSQKTIMELVLQAGHSAADIKRRHLYEAIWYAFNTVMCRNEIMLRHFGYDASFRCGKCDNCTRQGGAFEISGDTLSGLLRTVFLVVKAHDGQFTFTQLLKQLPQTSAVFKKLTPRVRMWVFVTALRTGVISEAVESVGRGQKVRVHYGELPNGPMAALTWSKQLPDF